MKGAFPAGRVSQMLGDTPPLSIIHLTPPHDPLAPKPDEERALDVEATLVPPRRALKP